MLGRMFVLGRVATANVSTGQAGAQVDPGVAQFETLFATGRGRFDSMKILEVIAMWHGRWTVSFFYSKTGS